MFDLINILSLAGWIYLFYVAIDYFGNKFFNLQIFKPRGIIKQALLVNIILLIIFVLGVAEMILTRAPFSNGGGLFSYFTHLALLTFIRVPWVCLYFFSILFLVLRIYQCISRKSQKNKIVKSIGLLTAIIFISFSLGITNYKVALCQLSYKNIGKTIISSEYPRKDCAKKIALENDESELCSEFGDPSECYYQLGVKTNDISFCKKIEEEGEYQFFAVDCYCKIALNTNDSSLCKKCNNHMEIRRCFIKTADISSITKNAIKEGEPQLCIQESDQEMDKCYYDFIKFYYDDYNLYLDLDCFPETDCRSNTGYCEKKIVCYDFFAKSPRSEYGKKYTIESFIKLCDSIKDKNLRTECYDFKK